MARITKERAALLVGTLFFCGLSSYGLVQLTKDRERIPEETPFSLDIEDGDSPPALPETEPTQTPPTPPGAPQAKCAVINNYGDGFNPSQPHIPNAYRGAISVGGDWNDLYRFIAREGAVEGQAGWVGLDDTKNGDSVFNKGKSSRYKSRKFVA